MDSTTYLLPQWYRDGAASVRKTVRITTEAGQHGAWQRKKKATCRALVCYHSRLSTQQVQHQV